MKILACDTSGPSCSVALLEDAVCREERRAQSPGGHASVFMPLVTDLLEDHALSPKDIDLFACVTGPGSFTGIRTGVAAVQAMAYAAGRPAVGVTALDALTRPLIERPDVLVCPVLDARNRRVYTQVLRIRPDGVPGSLVLPPQNTDIDRLLDVLATQAEPLRILFCGSAAPAVAEEAAARLGRDRVPAPEFEILSPLWAGQEARIRYGDGPPSAFPAYSLLPVYFGRSQAERTTGIDISDWTPETIR